MGRCNNGGGEVRGRRISRRAKRVFRACWDIWISGQIGFPAGDAGELNVHSTTPESPV